MVAKWTTTSEPECYVCGRKPGREDLVGWERKNDRDLCPKHRQAQPAMATLGEMIADRERRGR